MHAYLIMAHGQWGLLKQLLLMLDNKKNSIYIHVNALVAGVPFDELKKVLKYSKLYFVKRVPVYWGTFSVSSAILELLRASIGGNYQYYHLISGQDLPLKSQDYMHAFFDVHSGTNFINAYIPEELPEHFRNRVEKYHFGVKDARNNNIIKKLKYRVVDFFSMKFQYLFGVNRLKRDNIVLSGGATWFSITDDFAKYICNNEKMIRELFENKTYLADEVFLQSMAYMGGFENTFFKPKEEKVSTQPNLRLTDWKRGTPYVWKKTDYNELINSASFFARKFDETIDNEIVVMIKNYVLESSHD